MPGGREALGGQACCIPNNDDNSIYAEPKKTVCVYLNLNSDSGNVEDAARGRSYFLDQRMSEGDKAADP